jgi:hypothetical protein
LNSIGRSGNCGSLAWPPPWKRGSDKRRPSASRSHVGDRADELRRRQDRLLERRHKLARFRDPERSLETFDSDFNKKMNRALVYDLDTALHR